MTCRSLLYRKGRRLNEDLKRIYDRHVAALKLYARTWCRAPEDALQEAMIELAKQPEFPVEPVAWLYRAVRFRAMSQHRGERERFFGGSVDGTARLRF